MFAIEGFAIQSWLLFLPACFALNAAPGPNNITAFVNGARLDTPSALAAGMGRLPAFAILIGLTVVGLGAALAHSAAAFTAIKFVGAAYLIYVGVKLWRAPAPSMERAPNESVRALARQDFLVAIGNPKAIAIFTAFFPQFLDVGAPIAPQLLAMGVVFLILEVLAMGLYVTLGRLARGPLASFNGFGWLNKGLGAFLIGSGTVMATSQR